METKHFTGTCICSHHFEDHHGNIVLNLKQVQETKYND
jgi:hypothetical protein